MKLPNITGEYRFNYSLRHLNWFKVGGPAEIFFKPSGTLDLANFLEQNQQLRPVTVLGAGSNIIIRDGGIEGFVIKLGQNFTNIEFNNEKNQLSVGSGCLNFNLAKFCSQNNIAGFEFLVGIPGTIGGGIIMNAGAYNSEFKDIVISIEALDYQGKLYTLSNSEIGFKYRGCNLVEDLSRQLIITKIILKTLPGDQEIITKKMHEINEKRLATQPIKERTSGSTFANPVGEYSAWQLIDKAGMRGYKIGDASISILHCNFMINHGNATAKDLEDLGELVKKIVFEQSGIDLKWEIKRIGKYA